MAGPIRGPDTDVQNGMRFFLVSLLACLTLPAASQERPLPDYAGAFHPGRFDDPAYQQVLATLDPRAGQL